MKEMEMETQLDYFDTLANTQKQAMENLLSAQKQVRAQWLDTLQKMQESITALPGTPDIPQAKEAINLFNNWFSTMLNASKAIGDEALKLQETWNGALDTQVAISREVISNLSEISKPSKKK
jgi:hypothetical protein